MAVTSLFTDIAGNTPFHSSCGKLVYNTGSPACCSAMTQRGGMLGGDVNIYNYDSFSL